MTRYELAIDVAAIDAIDIHVHLETDAAGKGSLPDELQAAADRYFGSDRPATDIDSVAAYYRERRTAAVIFAVDAETVLHHPQVASEEVAEGAARNNDILIPFGSVDPHRPDALERVQRLISDYGVRGFKFHPTVQAFDPSEEAWFPIYDAIQAAGLPALFHTGQTGIGAGLPGGYGFRLGYSNPMLLDVVAAQFPALQIIMAHPSVPWQDEALSVATHKHNTWIDLSGWSPKYFPAELVRYANSLIKDRVLFGSDFPLITPDRWLRDVEHAAFKPEVLPGIMKGNAMRLLGLDD